MNHKIIQNPSYTNTVKIGLKLSPENEPLKFFLSSTELSRFPELIESAILPDGFVNEIFLFRPYLVMDWEDLQNAKGIKADEVEIYHQVFGSTFVKQATFNKILFDYCTKLLEVYRKSKEIPEGWVETMETGIKKLKQKIESQV